MDQTIHSRAHLNIHIRRTGRATEELVIGRGGHFMRCSLIGVREIDDLITSVGDLQPVAEQVFGMTSQREFLPQTGWKCHRP